VSSPIDSILALKPLDLRKEAMYPNEIGVEAGAKGFISISNTFTMQTLIRDGSVKVKGKLKRLTRIFHKLSLPQMQGAGHEAVALHCE